MQSYANQLFFWAQASLQDFVGYSKLCEQNSLFIAFVSYDVLVCI